MIKKYITKNKVLVESKAKGKSKKPFLHDVFFKAMYSKPKYSLDIFRLVLSKREQALFNWNTLKLEITSFLDKELSEKRADLLFSVNLKNSNERVGVLFLLEHKSSEDPNTLIQLLEYQTTIYKEKRMPIIPILFYHGKKREWKLPLNFHDFLKDFRGRLRRRFKKDVLNFRYRLLNVQSLDINTEAKGLTAQLILFIFKNIWDLDKPKARELFKLGGKLSEKDWKYIVSNVALYVKLYDPDFSWKVLQEVGVEVNADLKIFKPKGGDMSLLAQYALADKEEELIKKGMERGRQEGIERGRQAVILNMLKKKLDVSLISEVTGLSEEEIKKLKNGK